MEIIDQDDVFFADLSRQISLLIMDDDDELPVSHYHPTASFQAFSRVTHPRPNTQREVFYEQIYRREQTHQSKGTGVFIPRSTNSRRKKGIFNSNSANKKFQKQSADNSTGLPYDLPSNNYISLNGRRN